MKITKVADIVNGKVFLTSKANRTLDVAIFLTDHEVLERPDIGSKWTIKVKHGEGTEERLLELELAPQLSLSDPIDRPIFLGQSPLVFFRNRLFLPERYENIEAKHEEIFLRVRKYVYEEESELSGLRAVVANLEAAIEYPKSGQRRESIPENVKLLAWARDGGACAQCGSKKDIQFDHIIPVAKGGSNSETNIQILCQICNLRKSDKIATAQQK